MGTVVVNGTAMDVVEQGSGQTLVLVHGSASDSRTWRAQLVAFGEHFRTVAYSRRYHWPNETISRGANYALSEQVDDLEALVSSLGNAPTHLVGHSYGGLICLLLAVRSAGLVRSLVLAEPPAMTLLLRIPPKPVEILRLALRSPRTAMGIVKLGAFGLGPAGAAFQRGDAEKAMQKMGTAILGANAFKALSEERLAQVRDNLIPEETTSADFLPPLDPNKIRSIRSPVLLIGGDQSPPVFARLLDHLRTLMPNAQRAVVSGASHLMHEDSPVAFHEALMEFFEPFDHPSPNS